MSNAVVVISAEPEGALHPESKRHLRIGVVPAEHQNERVDENQAVGKRRQRKPPGRRDEQRHGDEDRKDLENPGRPIRGRNPRPYEQRAADDKQDDRLAWPHACTRSPRTNGSSSGGITPVTRARSNKSSTARRPSDPRSSEYAFT